MIEGVVNASLEATLVLTLSGPTGRTLEIEAVVDTGFSEFLMLPTDMTIDLGLEYVDVNEMVLADGSVETFDVFDVAVVWDGQSRCIDVHAAQGSPLVGMGLLHGHRLSVDVVEGARSGRTAVTAHAAIGELSLPWTGRRLTAASRLSILLL